MSASDQFRSYTDTGDPDPALGLANAETKGGGEPIDTGDTLGHDEVTVAHIDDPDSTKPERTTTAEASKVEVAESDQPSGLQARTQQQAEENEANAKDDDDGDDQEDDHQDEKPKAKKAQAKTQPKARKK